ncbi:MAG TPA: hypothetical protein VEB86_08145 [Chryseosolibacter sp.]|nr:hypothetical protein [Chryseosolibacter sp.]
MKSITRGFLPEIFSNPISRNLIIIFVATLLAAIFIVTATIVLFNQW